MREYALAVVHVWRLEDHYHVGSRGVRLLSLASFAFTYLDGPTLCFETVPSIGLDQDEAGCQKIRETHLSPSP